MATKVWTGAALDNDASNTLNYTGGIPVDGDDLVITGAQDITGGLDQSAITLASIRVAEACTAKIGSASAALTYGHITLLSYSGRGQYCKLGLSAATGEDGICTAASVSVAPGTTVYLVGGTWTAVAVSSKSTGELVVDATAIVTTLRNVSPGVTCTVSSNGTAITLCESVGYVTSRRAITTHTSLGPDRLTVTDSATMGTYNGSARSVYNHQSSGTITALNVRPAGSFPCTGSTRSFTITNANRYSGGYINTSPSGMAITFTNPIVDIGEMIGSGTGATIP